MKSPRSAGGFKPVVKLTGLAIKRAVPGLPWPACLARRILSQLGILHFTMAFVCKAKICACGAGGLNGGTGGNTMAATRTERDFNVQRHGHGRRGHV